MMNTRDLHTLWSRRQALRNGLLGAFGVGALSGCGGGGDSSGSTTSTSSTTGTTTTTTTTTTTPVTAPTTGGNPSCILIPEETQGPYPLDTIFNGATSDYFRSDITEGKTGVPLNLMLTVLNANGSCGPVSGARVYVWHCDKDGAYSGYNQQGSNTVGQTFLRGIQVTGSDGVATFKTIFPGWYNGRITHIHFRVYLSNGLAATSQLAFPPDITTAVYNTSLYAARGQNRSVASIAADNVFSDGSQYQICSMIANQEGGYDAYLSVGILG